MAEAYPVSLRTRVVGAYEAGTGSYATIARQFQIGSATVKRWVAQRRRTGHVAPRPKAGGTRSPVTVEEPVAKQDAFPPTSPRFDVVCPRCHRQDKVDWRGKDWWRCPSCGHSSHVCPRCRHANSEIDERSRGRQVLKHRCNSCGHSWGTEVPLDPEVRPGSSRWRRYYGGGGPSTGMIGELGGDLRDDLRDLTRWCVRTFWPLQAAGDLGEVLTNVSWRVNVWPAAAGAVLGAFPGVWRLVSPATWDVVAGLSGEWSVAVGSALGALAGFFASPLVGLTLTIASGAIGLAIALAIVLIVLAVIYCVPAFYFGWPPFS